MPVSRERRRNLDLIMTSSPNKQKSFSIDSIMNRESSKSPAYSTPSPDGSPFKATNLSKNRQSPPVPSRMMPGFMENLNSIAAAAAAAAASSSQQPHGLPFFHPHAAIYGNSLLMQQQGFGQPFNPWINRQSRIFPGGPPNMTGKKDDVLNLPAVN